jgi:hypothetical protein
VLHIVNDRFFAHAIKIPSRPTVREVESGAIAELYMMDFYRQRSRQGTLHFRMPIYELRFANGDVGREFWVLSSAIANRES